MENSEIPKVREVMLKRRKRQDEARAHTAAANIKSKKRAKVGYKLSFTRAEKLIKQARVKDRYELRLIRQAKRPQKKDTLPLEKKLIIAVRVGGSKNLHEHPLEALKLLRLKKAHSAVLLTQNRTTLELLKLAEPYVTWGYPNTETVRELIFKRGQTKIDGKKVALNNAVVEEHLGELGIICIEDVIHEILATTKNFKTVNAFLWNFQLSPPAGGWNKRRAIGPCGEKINALLRRAV